MAAAVDGGAESRVATAAPGAALNSAAHVNFKIVIPKVMYVQVDSAAGAADAGTVAVMSNNHNVTLHAALRSRFQCTARGNLILTSAARKCIAQNA